LERNSQLGGQLLWTHNPIKNYLGVEAGNGRELAKRFADQVRGAEIELLDNLPVTSVDLRTRSVKTTGGEVYSADAIVIATGVRRRKLGVPGEDEFAGRGILVSGVRDGDLIKGKSVVIVGGGDAALENALMLGRHAERVTIVHRRGEFTARTEFVEAAAAKENVEFMLESEIAGIDGRETVENVAVRKRMGEESVIDCDAVLIRIGIDPNTELFATQLELDERGYIVVDGELRTSIRGVWAIGDATGPTRMTIAGAGGHGAISASSILDSIGC
jgi:thioredoxin reductase (NADPH)